MASFNNKAEMSALEVSILFCFSQIVQFSDKVSLLKAFTILYQEVLIKLQCVGKSRTFEDDCLCHFAKVLIPYMYEWDFCKQELCKNLTLEIQLQWSINLYTIRNILSTIIPSSQCFNSSCKVYLICKFVNFCK